MSLFLLFTLSLLLMKGQLKSVTRLLKFYVFKLPLASGLSSFIQLGLPGVLCFLIATVDVHTGCGVVSVRVPVRGAATHYNFLGCTQSFLVSVYSWFVTACQPHLEG